MKIPVILDTDIGSDIDDTWALGLLLKSPEVDLRLAVSATGDTRYRARLLAKMLQTAGRSDVPVGVGLDMQDESRRVALDLHAHPAPVPERRLPGTGDTHDPPPAWQIRALPDDPFQIVKPPRGPPSRS